MTKVSVIVATYRREQPLAKALHSLAQQTYKAIEIILVDDNGSREWNARVAGIAKEFKEHHCTMDFKTIVNDRNMGSAEARNVGIHAASGEYVTFLDDDDEYLPKKIEKQVAFMESNTLDYSITDLDLFFEDGKLHNRRIRSYICQTTPEALTRYHLMYHLTGTDTLMFRRDYLEKIGGFAPINVGDEFYLMQRAIDGAGSFGYLPGCEVRAYIHTGEGGLSSGDGKIKGENELYRFKKSYFATVDAKTRRYIRMRHYAVLAFAEMRRKRFLPFAVYAGMSFLCSPVQFFKLLRGRR